MNNNDNKIADLEKLLLATREALEQTSDALKVCYADSHCIRVEFLREKGLDTVALVIENIRRHSGSLTGTRLSALTPDAVRAKYVTAEELRRVSEERDAARCVREQYEGDARNYHERLKECITERDEARQKVAALEKELTEARANASELSQSYNMISTQLSAANEAREKAEEALATATESALQVNGTDWLRIVKERDAIRRQLEEAEGKLATIRAALDRFRDTDLYRELTKGEGK